MADQQLEDIEFRQDFIEKDSGSPLHLIREKEMEITGRVLKAKRDAEELVADSRRKAAEVVGSAESEGGTRASSREEDIRKEFAAEIEKVGVEAEKDLGTMQEKIAATMPKAVEAVVAMVTDL